MFTSNNISRSTVKNACLGSLAVPMLKMYGSFSDTTSEASQDSYDKISLTEHKGCKGRGEKLTGQKYIKFSWSGLDLASLHIW